MTLTNRLTLFVLATLALVLAGFSIALYFVASSYLHRQADERLETALNTLVAAAEVGPDGVEWEPAGRSITIGPRAPGDQLAWTVTDGAGLAIARSAHPDTEDLLVEAAGRLTNSTTDARRLDWQGERWLASFRRLLPDASAQDAPRPRSSDPKEIRHPSLVITAALPLEPLRKVLRQLRWALLGVSGSILALSAVAGRFVCRRALQPVREMAAASRSMSPTDIGQRLRHPNRGDELDDLGRSFNGLLDRLHESFERQKRFTGDASHQLRTPLAAVLGQIEVALRRPRSVEEYHRVLSTIYAKAGHLQRIVESLLFLARADAEAMAPRGEPIDLSIWLPGHLSTWSEHPRSADLQVELDPGPASVRAHPVLLGELLNVLIDNACRYSPGGTPIAIRLCSDNGRPRLDVIDEGDGIDETDLPHIFEPFARSTNARRTNHGGVGLGLSIAARLAKSFGGSLEVANGRNRGSRFTLTFPAEASPFHPQSRCSP